MYKNGGVNQIKPATKQPEWSTKILAYYGETEKKTTSNVQDVQPDIMHESETRDDQLKVTDWHQLLDLWFISWWTRAEVTRHRGSDLPPCDSELWERFKSLSHKVGIQMLCYWNSCFIALTWSVFWILLSGSWNGKVRPCSAAVSGQTQRTRD